jgi:hypothetical protein
VRPPGDATEAAQAENVAPFTWALALTHNETAKEPTAPWTTAFCAAACTWKDQPVKASRAGPRWDGRSGLGGTFLSSPGYQGRTGPWSSTFSKT